MYSSLGWDDKTIGLCSSFGRSPDISPFLGGMCCNTCGTLGESEISGESIPDLDDLGKMR